MQIDLKKQFSEFLQRLSESLDISEDHYKKAGERYQSLGRWLSRNGSRVAEYSPDIYSQGSFRLGTAVKPITDADEYDVDLVCELSLGKNQLSQKNLKDLVGVEIAGYARAHNIKSAPENNRRCWTLNYSDGVQFHMDILPALPDGDSFRSFLESKGVSSDWTDLAIAITDNRHPNYEIINGDWLSSNPKGYEKWFKQRMEIQREALFKHAESMQANVEPINKDKLKTPLQRAVQLLKRHRDIMFADDQDDKPISIIISTLAAHAYNNEPNILDGLVNIVKGMANYIEERECIAWVSNPVNPTENFADKWQQHPQREVKFKKWINQVRNDLEIALQKGDIREIAALFELRFGEIVVGKALRHSIGAKTGGVTGLIVGQNRQLSHFNVPHRDKPLWTVECKYSVSVSGKFTNNGSKKIFSSNSAPLAKGIDLFFVAETDVPEPFKVFWQIVNTGIEAESENGLRGEIFPSKTAGVGGLRQKESTSYTGMHWIECFIVKDGICVARSGEYVVNII